MAIETKPAWVEELKKKLAQPRTPEQQARAEEWGRRVEALNAGKTWPPGTFQRLLDMAHAEDEEEEEEDDEAARDR